MNAARRLAGAVRTGGRCWGELPEERAARYPCDAMAAGSAMVLYRAIDVRAPADQVFRWLCQLAVAPYSYDRLDNGGRRSPRALTPGADDLRVGQPVMTIFRLESFAVPEHLTLRMAEPRAVEMFDDLVLSYVVRPSAEGASRIVVKLLLPRRPGWWQAVRRRALTVGDLVMMAKQLRTLRALAEGA